MSEDKLVAEIKKWIDMSRQQMRLHCGEMTEQEIRTVKAVLNAILENAEINSVFR